MGKVMSVQHATTSAYQATRQMGLYSSVLILIASLISAPSASVQSHLQSHNLSSL